MGAISSRVPARGTQDRRSGRGTDSQLGVAAHGFRKIGVVSGHGGNMPGLELGALKVVQQRSPEQSVRIALFRGHQDAASLARRSAIFASEPGEGQPGIHAARWETAETLADRPHLVRLDKLVRPTMKQDPPIPEWIWQTHELTETGAFGDPSLARPQSGEEAWAMWAEAVALFLKRLWDAPLS